MSAALMVPTAVPAAPVDRSQDVPSGPEVRPFGLAGATLVPASVPVSLDGLRWDEQQQVTVAADGTALAENPLAMTTTVVENTRYDNTNGPDTNVVD